MIKPLDYYKWFPEDPNFKRKARLRGMNMSSMIPTIASPKPLMSIIEKDNAYADEEYDVDFYNFFNNLPTFDTKSPSPPPERTSALILEDVRDSSALVSNVHGQPSQFKFIESPFNVKFIAKIRTPPQDYHNTEIKRGEGGGVKRPANESPDWPQPRKK